MESYFTSLFGKLRQKSISSQEEGFNGTSLYRERVVRLTESPLQGKYWCFSGFFLLGSAIHPRPGSLFCNKILIFSSLKPPVRLFFFDWLWILSAVKWEQPCWGLPCPASREARGGTKTSKGRVQPLPSPGA